MRLGKVEKFMHKLKLRRFLRSSQTLYTFFMEIIRALILIKGEFCIYEFRMVVLNCIPLNVILKDSGIVKMILHYNNKFMLILGKIFAMKITMGDFS